MKASSPIALAVLSLTAAILPMLTPQPADAAIYCQCVGYVKKVYGINRAMGNAKDMNSSLPSQGFQRIYDPRPGDIVVMQPSFPGSDKTYGHVGFVHAIDGAGKMTVRGANQSTRYGSKRYTQAGCNNVNEIRFGTSIRGRSDLAFWRKGGGSSNSHSTSGIPNRGIMVSVATRKALDTGGNGGKHIYPHPEPNSQNRFHSWDFKNLGGNKYMIISRATGRALDGGGANGGDVYPHPSPNSNNPYHSWSLKPVGDKFLVINDATGRALDAGGANGHDVYMHSRPNGANPFHLWSIRP